MNGARVQSVTTRVKLRLIDMKDQEAASAAGRIPCPLTVDPNERAVRLLPLAVFQQEVFRSRIRALHRDVIRSVRERRGIEAIRPVRGERRERNPPELVQRPRFHARGAERRREVARAHEAPLPDALRRSLRVV